MDSNYDEPSLKKSKTSIEENDEIHNNYGSNQPLDLDSVISTVTNTPSDFTLLPKEINDIDSLVNKINENNSPSKKIMNYQELNTKIRDLNRVDKKDIRILYSSRSNIDINTLLPISSSSSSTTVPSNSPSYELLTFHVLKVNNSSPNNSFASASPEHFISNLNPTQCFNEVEVIFNNIISNKKNNNDRQNILSDKEKYKHLISNKKFILFLKALKSKDTYTAKKLFYELPNIKSLNLTYMEEIVKRLTNISIKNRNFYNWKDKMPHPKYEKKIKSSELYSHSAELDLPDNSILNNNNNNNNELDDLSSLQDHQTRYMNINSIAEEPDQTSI